MSCIVTLLQPVVVCPEIGATGREVAGILHLLAANIDARQFNPVFPATFPRFVQSAIWRYCAENGLAICNGNQIDDAARCDNRYCQLFRRCDRIALRAEDAKYDDLVKNQ